MLITRRDLLTKGGTVALGAALFPGRLVSQNELRNPEIIPDDFFKSIASNAIDVAVSEGASYSEIYMRRSLSRTGLSTRNDISRGDVLFRQHITIGIRSLVDGRWGFASSNQLENKEVTRLSLASVYQAKENARVKARPMEWKFPASMARSYVSPGIDPFSISMEEVTDFINSWRSEVIQFRNPHISLEELKNTRIAQTRHESFFASSLGSNLKSIQYITSGAFEFSARYKRMQPMSGTHVVSARGLDMQQAGWEAIRDAELHKQIPDMMEQSASRSMIGISPVDIGRFDVVCDQKTVASILNNTIVRATELDRVLGYEANAGGTSYLGPDIYSNLGSSVGSEKLSISLTRSLSKGIGSIPWDAEGVPAKDFHIVEQGKLVNYQTNIEVAPGMDKWYESNGIEPGSNGCSFRSDGSSFPIISSPDITIRSSEHPISLEDLIGSVKKGYFVPEATAMTSFQCQDGYIRALAREITNGKLGNFVQMGILFDTPELLGNISALGGKDSSLLTGVHKRKGEPVQNTWSTARTVPISFTNVAVIDPARKL